MPPIQDKKETARSGAARWDHYDAALDSTLWTHRRGYWFFQRAYFDALRREHGPVAHQIMVDLISNAGVSTHSWTPRDGSKGTLERGWALFSVRGCADRLGRSPTTVHRVFRGLVESGHVQIVKKGRRLKHGKGTAPTIVNILRYDDFSSRKVTARYALETSLATEERMNEESHLQRENELSPMDDLRFNPSARHASAADVLKWYGRWITNARDRAAAVRAIESALSADHSAESLIAAADHYAAAVLDRNEHHRMPPEHFYVKAYELYIEVPSLPFSREKDGKERPEEK